MAERIKSSIGPELVKRGNHWEIDLSHLRVFFGLSVLAHILSDDILNLVNSTTGDLSYLYKINPGINPELHGMKISHIQVHARTGILLPEYLHGDEFQNHLRTVLGTLQMPSWMNRLHPTGGKFQPSSALIFPFHVVSDIENVNYQFILERMNSPKNAGEYFLRLTIENFQKTSLDLKNIPHVVVDDIRNRTYIEGCTKISESLTYNIQTACHRGSFYFAEENRLHNRVFEQLAKTRLGNLDCINVFWDRSFADLIIRSKPEEILPESKKLLLSLESDEICKLLTDGMPVKVILKNTIVFIDLSRRSRVLNYSFNRQRKKIGMDFYLHRMPELNWLSRKNFPGLDFQGINIFLLHHITSEVISLIDTLFRKKAPVVWACFVKYAGNIPPLYLDILLDIPHECLFMASLERKRNEFNVDYYALSQEFSDTDTLAGVQALLEKKKLDYFSAMRLLAGHLFLRYCLESEEKGRKVLLIEDGGYLAPFLNQFASEGKTLNQVLSKFGHGLVKDNIQFHSWISNVLVGTVEHTRNGYDRLIQYEKKFGSFFPSYSIAVSNKKVNEESKEVARSVINAIESILYGQGLTLSGRKIMVFGAGGNIGRFLCEKLPRDKIRIHEKNQIKIDLKYTGDGKYEYRTINDVPEKLFFGADLFIGLTGKSILTTPHIERLLLRGRSTNLFFASGSTKTLEYTHLIEYLKKLSFSKKPTVGGFPIIVRFDRIIDPQTGLDQGGRVTLEIFNSNKTILRTLYLLGDLSPINFLYYGVPAESMDSIISQLIRLSLGIVRRYRKKILPERGIYAVDREVDEWARPISAPDGI